MRVCFTTPQGVAFSEDAATPKAAFEFLATVQESFGEGCCGACGSAAIRYEVREFTGVTGQFFKLVCRDCHAQLDFGQLKDGKGIFPKRRGEDGHGLPNGGWYHYRAPDAPPPDRPVPPAALRRG